MKMTYMFAAALMAMAGGAYAADLSETHTTRIAEPAFSGGFTTELRAAGAAVVPAAHNPVPVAPQPQYTPGYYNPQPPYAPIADLGQYAQEVAGRVRRAAPSLRPYDREELELLLRRMNMILYDYVSYTQPVSLICRPDGRNWYTVFDPAANTAIGQPVLGLSACQAAIKTQREDFVCRPDGRGWHTVYFMERRQALGASVLGLDSCSSVINNIRYGYICRPDGRGWHTLYSIQSNSAIGQSVLGLDICLSVIPAY